MKGTRGGRTEVYGGNMHQKLVEYAEKRLRAEGAQTILYEVDPGTNISIDVVGIKNGHRTGVECYLQAQLKSVRLRIAKMTVDRIVFCVPNEKTAERFMVLGEEVWNAGLEYGIKTVKVSVEIHRRLDELCSKNVSFGEIIAFLLEAYERAKYYALNGGNLYDIGYCSDFFEALEIAREEEGYDPYVQTKIFHGLCVFTKSGERKEEKGQ